MIYLHLPQKHPKTIVNMPYTEHLGRSSVQESFWKTSLYIWAHIHFRAGWCLTVPNKETLEVTMKRCFLSRIALNSTQPVVSGWKWWNNHFTNTGFESSHWNNSCFEYQVFDNSQKNFGWNDPIWWGRNYFSNWWPINDTRLETYSKSFCSFYSNFTQPHPTWCFSRGNPLKFRET